MLLALVVAERDDADDDADSDEPDEDEEGTLSEALVAARYVPEPESVFEFELDVDDVDEVEEDELAHASGSDEGNSEPPLLRTPRHRRRATRLPRHPLRLSRSRTRHLRRV